MTSSEFYLLVIKPNVKDNHSLVEWQSLYGEDEDMWDFTVDDVLNGAIELDEGKEYWLIGGRVYETDREFKESEKEGK